MIYDCSTEMTKYHNEKVRLSEKEQGKLRDYRDANLERLKNGLTKNGGPAYEDSISQGSYAMHTLNQHPENDYDIDVGIIFDREDIKGSQGGDKTALAVRQMVCNAMQDDRFNKQPEVLKNCVRVYYEEGHHVDMPVYRRYEDENGNIVQELASSNWEESDPEAITEWFKEAVIEKSPDKANGRQMRRITRLIKKWARSRSSWNMPSGFIISVLVDEKYVAKAGRDDESLYETLKAIRDRLSEDMDVYNPVNCDLISDGKESKLQKIYDELDKVLMETLNVLENADCTHEQAMKAWSKFFNDDFFEDQINRASESKSTYEAIDVTARPWRSN
ncbi:cyclic GMP-AMP synthase DncV-like nucleotidyltransferase [Nitrosophilus alvini]|uniref:cyclic GMP-AMP synthase DncV-like nucleotidyltransferase n=1 Tax=Nitrosophilus alvini TaxID=2714855 RepID=UPI00190B1B60|nr:hypothetical protein [Nitrosophilus alvini]